jgi:hypothetical protein
LDARGPIILLLSVGLAYWTWSANRSGKLTLKASFITREENPRMFRLALVVQALFAALTAIVAAAVMLGLMPINSN